MIHKGLEIHYCLKFGWHIWVLFILIYWLGVKVGIKQKTNGKWRIGKLKIINDKFLAHFKLAWILSKSRISTPQLTQILHQTFEKMTKPLKKITFHWLQYVTNNCFTNKKVIGEMNSIHNMIGTMLLFHMWPTAINCSYLHPIFYLGPFQYLKSMSSCIQKWFKSMGTTPMSRFLHFFKESWGSPPGLLQWWNWLTGSCSNIQDIHHKPIEMDAPTRAKDPNIQNQFL